MMAGVGQYQTRTKQLEPPKSQINEVTCRVWITENLDWETNTKEICKKNYPYSVKGSEGFIESSTLTSLC